MVWLSARCDSSSSRQIARVYRNLFAALFLASAFLAVWWTLNVHTFANSTQVARPVERKPDSGTVAQQQLLSNNLLRERDRRRLLAISVARAAVERGDVNAAVAAWDSIHRGAADGFLWSDTREEISSVFSEVARQQLRLLQTNPEGYRNLQEGRARGLRATDSQRSHRDLLNRYLFTPTGRETAITYASTRFDAGDFDFALALAEDLDRSPFGPIRSEKLLRQMLIAGKMTGDKKTIDYWLSRLRNRKVADSSADSIAASSEIEQARSWFSATGHRTHQQITAASLPLLRPRWSHAYIPPDSVASSIVTAFARERSKQRKSFALSNTPLVVDDVVIYRSTRTISAIDRRDGKLIWSFPCLSQPGFLHKGVASLSNPEVCVPDSRVFNGLSSNGRLVFAIDSLETTAEPAARNNPDRFQPRTLPNRLIALSVYPEPDANEEFDHTISPAWEIEPQTEDGTPACFRGVPVVAGGLLYAVVESPTEVAIWCMLPENGRVLWRQGLMYTSDQLSENPARAMQSCDIACSRGVLICPTSLDVIVAYDAIRGRLLWAQHLDDVPASDTNLFVRPSRRRRQKSSHVSFLSPPVISGRKVFVLQPESTELRVFDLHSGSPLWKIPREDAEYLGGVADDRLLIVGRQHCRAVAVETGETIWQHFFGMPSGRGLMTDGEYLLPLQSGRIARFSMVDGQEQGLDGSRLRFPGVNQLVAAGPEPAAFEKRADEKPLISDNFGKQEDGRSRQEFWFPGNLVPAGDLILSSSINGLFALPVSKAIAPEIAARLQKTPDDLAARLQAAELDLLAGRLNAAEGHLQVVLNSPAAAEFPVADAHYRELLFAKLLHGSPAVSGAKTLQTLRARIRTPVEKARLLAAEIRFASGKQDWLTAEDRIIELAQLGQRSPELLVNADGDSSRQVSPETLAYMLNEELHATASKSGGQQQLLVRRDARLKNLLETPQPTAIETFLTLNRNTPAADRLLITAGRLAMESGRFQAAELLWLQSLEAGDPVLTATARRELVRLYQRCALPRQAAIHVEELRRQATGSFLDEETVQEFLASVDGDPVLRNAELDRLPVARHPDGVQFRTQLSRCENDRMRELFGDFVNEAALPFRSPVLLYNKQSLFNQPMESGLAVIDRDSCVITGKLEIPQQHSWPLPEMVQSGSFLPVGVAGAARGMSLLEASSGGVTWKTPLLQPFGLKDVVLCGPAGKTFAVFQAGTSISVIDPRTGRILWRRELDSQSAGLVSDPRTGILADEQAVVVLHEDHKSYTVYETVTGAQITKGLIDIAEGKIRRAFGRRIFYMPANAEGLRLRIHDPLTGATELDEKVSRVVNGITPDGELIVLMEPEKSGEPHRLQIRNVEANRVILEIPITADQFRGSSYLRAFRHFDRYYISLQSFDRRFGRRGSSNSSVSNLVPSAEAVDGVLIAYDTSAAEVLWEREISQCSLLRNPWTQPPVLIAISQADQRFSTTRRRSDPFASRREVRYQIEVLDTATGDTLAKTDGLMPDRYVRCDYNRVRQTITLTGLLSEVTIDFSAYEQIPDTATSW